MYTIPYILLSPTTPYFLYILSFLPIDCFSLSPGPVDRGDWKQVVLRCCDSQVAASADVDYWLCCNAKNKNEIWQICFEF